MKRWRIVVQDESIFVWEVTIKKVWAKIGSKPRVKVTGSREKTCVYGALSNDGKQLFRRYPKCNTVYFIEYLKEMKRTFGKFVVFLDKSSWHKSKKTTEFLHAHRKQIKVFWFPAGFPEANPVEECWNLGKHDDDLGAKWFPDAETFRQAISQYYRNKRFNLNLEHYLCP